MIEGISEETIKAVKNAYAKFSDDGVNSQSILAAITTLLSSGEVVRRSEVEELVVAAKELDWVYREANLEVKLNGEFMVQNYINKWYALRSALDKFTTPTKEPSDDK